MLGLSVHPSEEDQAFDTYIQDLLVDPSTVTDKTFKTIRQMYPANDTSLGGPFNTGDSLFDRAEAWYGDNMYLAPRRLFFEAAASYQPLFGYYFQEFIPGNDPTMGGMSDILSDDVPIIYLAPVSHGSELRLLFGPVLNSVQLDFANRMLDFYINFINDLHPGGTNFLHLPSRILSDIYMPSLLASIHS